MKHDFEVGMRVVCVKSDGSTIEGEEGTVVAIRRYDDVIIVEFDNEFIGGHSCGGRCKDGQVECVTL